MSDEAADSDGGLGAIRDLCDGPVSFMREGWRKLIYMEKLRFLVGNQHFVSDAVICLNHDNATYPTKLYLTENLGCGLNWNETAYLLSRHWHTFSWSGVHPNQPYIDILAAHLAPLAKARAA